MQKKEIAAIPVPWLWRAYKKQYGIDIGRLVPPGTKTLRLLEDSETGLRAFTPVLLGDGPFYEALSRFEGYYQKWKREYATAAHYTTGKSILEIGCGLGDFAELAQARHYLGLEISEASVEKAKKLGRNTILSTPEDYLSQHRPRQFDVVCAFQVLEHVPAPITFIKTAAELLRDEGRFILSVPNDEGFIGYAPNNILNMPPHHQTRWTAKTIAAVAEKAGLEIEALIFEMVDAIHTSFASRILSGAVFLPLSIAQNQHVYLSPLKLFAYKVKRAALRPVMARLAQNGFIENALKGHTLTAVLRKAPLE
ncbi:MAG: methyltransferase domain-containing protein [Verrucomicrobia bacterium]|jgi:2-polyprenyl-3-methyl-5-hydroxy-6-metoxy-1,4-benzoquinol methylase|nr:methyltransferase domain-containing protein [Verrucomicrobiota bacterium]